MSIRPFRDIKRKKTKEINVGKVKVGGNNPISVQSMTNTLTTDIKATIDQINKTYVPEMMGVIEAPITKMMKAYPDEFKFMRHQTKREKLEDRDIKKK